MLWNYNNGCIELPCLLCSCSVRTLQHSIIHLQGCSSKAPASSSMILVIIWCVESPSNVRECNVFLDQNTIAWYKSPNNNLSTFVDFLDQLIYALFCPAPRTFILAPPLHRWEKLCPAHPRCPSCSPGAMSDDARDNLKCKSNPNSTKPCGPFHTF